MFLPWPECLLSECGRWASQNLLVSPVYVKQSLQDTSGGAFPLCGEVTDGLEYVSSARHPYAVCTGPSSGGQKAT